MGGKERARDGWRDGRRCREGSGGYGEGDSLEPRALAGAAEQVESAYGECKASALCAMAELEDEPYQACIRRTRREARPPLGWIEGVKRKP